MKMKMKKCLSDCIGKIPLIRYTSFDNNTENTYDFPSLSVPIIIYPNGAYTMSELDVALTSLTNREQ